jgi:hypothetical protein
MSQPPPRDEGRSPEHGQAPSWPSAGQPPAWPGGGQPQPPAWPTEGQPQPSSGSSDEPGQGLPPPPGQPPYPGPGRVYGDGSGPSRFSGRHPFRGILIALVFFVVLGVVVRAATGSHSVAGAAMPFPSDSGNLATGRQAPPGRVGSSFDLRGSGGNTYQVTLVKVVDPAQGAGQLGSPGSGKRLVGLVFRIKALTGSPQDEDADTDAVLVGGNGQNYSAEFSGIAGYTNFDDGIIRVAQGDTVTGAVAFQVPAGVMVSAARWSALSGFGSMVEWDLAGLAGRDPVPGGGNPGTGRVLPAAG